MAGKKDLDATKNLPEGEPTQVTPKGQKIGLPSLYRERPLPPSRGRTAPICRHGGSKRLLICSTFTSGRCRARTSDLLLVRRGD
jgi:hypothetical protein